MKKKIRLFLIVTILGGLAWYLFLKPHDYLATFKIKASAGSINQSIKAWSLSLDNSAIIDQKDLNNLTQQLTLNDSIYNYRWEIKPENDSISKVWIYVKSMNHSLKNRISTPFKDTDFEKRTRRTLVGFHEELTEKLKKFKVRIVGKDTFPDKYCAYILIKSKQSQKAKDMKQNYLLLSDFISSNKIKLNGTPMAEITKWDITTDSIHYNFCFPIIKSDSLPVHRLIKYKQLNGRPSLKAIYNGNYITSDRAWYSLLDYAEKSNTEIIPKPIEVYNNNPNMGGDELRWKTDVYMPIK